MKARNVASDSGRMNEEQEEDDEFNCKNLTRCKENLRERVSQDVSLGGSLISITNFETDRL